jgi:hypothetical protein
VCACHLILLILKKKNLCICLPTRMFFGVFLRNLNFVSLLSFLVAEFWSMPRLMLTSFAVIGFLTALSSRKTLSWMSAHPFQLCLAPPVVLGYLALIAISPETMQHPKLLVASFTDDKPLILAQI